MHRGGISVRGSVLYRAVALGLVAILFLDGCGKKREEQVAEEPIEFDPGTNPGTSPGTTPPTQTGWGGTWNFYYTSTSQPLWTMNVTAGGSGLTATVNRNLTTIGLQAVQVYTMAPQGSRYAGSLLNSYSNGTKDMFNCWWEMAGSEMAITIQRISGNSGLIPAGYVGSYRVKR